MIAVYWWSVEGTGLNIVTLIEGLPNFGEMLRQMFPPDVGYAARLWEPLVETLAIGILATLIGSVLAIPMGFLAAENISHAAIYYPARMVLNVLRGISELIWALLFVVAVGLGPFAGVLALVIFSIGVLGKLIAEALEAVEPGPLDAMRATGASRWKVFLYGAWPQILPLYLSYCLYWWDHNTRQATILGFVGAGGLGYSLFFSITTFEFEKATTAILSMILVITVIDRFCLYLRKKII
ncbi:phosphonate ABC transporter, permease protein PhnE [Candidatus Uhrbacteria bacterium]|nr:phosphonate ABC transporter, permease protein PhnE [Candidatus Uhrbacteria bacterium]